MSFLKNIKFTKSDTKWLVLMGATLLLLFSLLLSFWIDSYNKTQCFSKCPKEPFISSIEADMCYSLCFEIDSQKEKIEKWNSCKDSCTDDWCILRCINN